MGLALRRCEEIRLRANGIDEQNAITVLEKFLTNKEIEINFNSWKRK
jgi:phosphotransferase system HPr-like phosphotransfer protein